MREHTRLTFIVGAVLIATVVLPGLPACGSGEDACISEGAKVSAVTNKSMNASCPRITPAEINGGGGGAVKCTSTVDTDACTVALTCDQEAAGTVVRGSGSFSANAGTARGDLALTISPPGGAVIACTYALTFR